MTAAPEVRAGGGIVWRQGAGGRVEVLLVHRPRYGDWSFPKGKCEPGEADDACALREVEEETGLRCALGVEVGQARYVDNRGRDKLVRYWAMTPVDDTGFVPGDEVDAVAWVPLDEATARLTYAHDAEVLRRFAAPV